LKSVDAQVGTDFDISDVLPFHYASTIAYRDIFADAMVEIMPFKHTTFLVFMLDSNFLQIFELINK